MPGEFDSNSNNGNSSNLYNSSNSNVLFLLVQMLMGTFIMSFILSLAINVNFTTLEKYLKFLIKDSIDLFLRTRNPTTYPVFKSINTHFRKGYCKDSSYIAKNQREQDVQTGVLWILELNRFERLRDLLDA